MGDWVRYKLDRQVDHVLVDEAQDTNAAQWEIIEQLVEEFFTGSSESRGSAAAPCSWSATSSRRSTASRAPIPKRFREAREEFKRRADALRGGGDLFAYQQQRARVPRPVDRRQLPFGPADPRRRRRGDRQRRPSAHWRLPSRRRATSRIMPTARARSSCGSRSRSSSRRRERRGRGALGQPARPRNMPSALAERIRADGRGSAVSCPRLKRRADAGRHPRAGAQPRRARIADRRPAVLGRRSGRRRRPAASARAARGPGSARRRAGSRSSRNDDLSLACLLVSPLIGWDQEQLRALAYGRPGKLWRELRQRADEDDISAQRMTRCPRCSGSPTSPRRRASSRPSCRARCEGRRKLYSPPRNGGARRDRRADEQRAGVRAQRDRLARPVPRLVLARDGRGPARSWPARQRGPGDDRARRQRARSAGGDPRRCHRRSGAARPSAADAGHRGRRSGRRAAAAAAQGRALPAVRRADRGPGAARPARSICGCSTSR